MSTVESTPVTTRVGGVTGKGFTPGVSGNPGGRPKGLSRRVRELLGEDGGAIADYMVSVMEMTAQEQPIGSTPASVSPIAASGKQLS